MSMSSAKPVRVISPRELARRFERDGWVIPDKRIHDWEAKKAYHPSRPGIPVTLPQPTGKDVTTGHLAKIRRDVRRMGLKSPV
jgi:predicted RNA binding protein YcfA (HicA-like mRNA interferase family)